MIAPLNLVVETPLADYEYVFEEKNKDTPRTLFIKGPYMLAEGVNRNKRLYPLDEMVREVKNYNETFVAMKRAMGELNHPESADVNLERACHLITELRQDGNVFMGKSKVLNTPCGLIVKSLVEDGVTVGMSSRALGRLEESKGYNTVRDFKLVAVDCVADPSFPKAFVNGILESKQYVLQVDGSYEEYYDKLEQSISRLPKKYTKEYLQEQIMKFIRSL